MGGDFTEVDMEVDLPDDMSSSKVSAKFLDFASGPIAKPAVTEQDAQREAAERLENQRNAEKKKAQEAKAARDKAEKRRLKEEELKAYEEPVLTPDEVAWKQMQAIELQRQQMAVTT